MNKEVAEKFLRCIAHEQSQDVETTSELLNSLPLQKLVAKGLAVNNLTLENLRTGPVSYTHLDVYKRQLLSRELFTSCKGLEVRARHWLLDMLLFLKSSLNNNLFSES